MQREYCRWFSPHLNREMEFLWFGRLGRPLLMFPTSQGRFYQYEDFGLVQSLANKIERGETQLVCVDSVDAESWYNSAAHPADRALRHEQYDHYLRRELIPYVHQRAQPAQMDVFGASFGAYHAANLAARYPEAFHKAILFSGIYDITRFLDGYSDDRCYFHNPTAYIANMDSGWIARLGRVQWIIATGEHDSLVECNRQFSRLMYAKGIPCQLEIWPGVFGHDWVWWNANLTRFLP